MPTPFTTKPGAKTVFPNSSGALWPLGPGRANGSPARPLRGDASLHTNKVVKGLNTWGNVDNGPARQQEQSAVLG